MELLIETQEQLEKLIAEWGFMPFFKNKVRGFSIEELVPDDLLFSENGDGGAWQWKGPIISHWESAYGKFFASKAGFISLEWLPDFINWRRSLFPLERMPADAKNILKVLRENESMVSRKLKAASGFTLSRKKKRFNPDDPSNPIVLERTGADFDSLITQLQMGTYVCIADFEYLVSKKGEKYGWGLALYCTPEAMYEIDWQKAVEGRTPEQSRERICNHLKELFPAEPDKAWNKIVGK